MKKNLVMISALVLLLLAGWIAFRSFRAPERDVRPVTSEASTTPFSSPPDSSLPTPKESPNAATSITPFWPSPETSFAPTAQVVTSPTSSPRTPKKTPQVTVSPTPAPIPQSAPTFSPTPEATPPPTPTPAPSREPHKFFVFIVGSQFQPASLEIHVGDTVTWVNKDKNTLHWPASDPHPTHTALAGFDALGDIGFEESYSYTFTAAGSLPYHDHSAAVVAGVATVKGTITVTP